MAGALETCFSPRWSRPPPTRLPEAGWIRAGFVFSIQVSYQHTSERVTRAAWNSVVGPDLFLPGSPESRTNPMDLSTV